MNEVIFAINSGSSSIKFSLFSYKQKLNLLYHGDIANILDASCLTIYSAKQIQVVKQHIATNGYAAGLSALFNWFEHLSETMSLTGIGHRVIYGGMCYAFPTLVTDEVMMEIENLIPLAPLHQPHSLEAIKIISALYPKLPQVACFDTSFHRTQEKLATLFALPRPLIEAGIIRYGFHGISYEYIASVITQYIGDRGNQRVITAHLGNGASMCAMVQGKSVATSMGFTALDGLMMGTRCGRIDPGVLLYLMQEKNYTLTELQHLLYEESGLLGVSGISHDMRELLLNPDPKAQEAIDLFCYRAALEVGSLAMAINGIDALVFTAGIGEKAAYVREKICAQLSWLGLKLNDKANENNASIISADSSTIVVCVIPTNEEFIIAKHTLHILEHD